MSPQSTPPATRRFSPSATSRPTPAPSTRTTSEKPLAYLNQLPGEAGYFTETFCVQSRFFQPFNGERVDAIRNRLEAEFKGSSSTPSF